MKSKFIILCLSLLLINTELNAQQGWFQQTSGTSEGLNSVFFVTENIGWVAGDNGTILKTTDSGENWILLSSGISENLTSIFFVDSSMGWVVGDYGKIINSTDGGNSWTHQQGGTNRYLRSVYFTNDTIGYVAGLYGTILKTTNAGVDWLPLSGGDNYNLSDIFFLDENTGWIAGAGKVILKTTDAGVNWTLQLYYGNNLWSIRFIDQNNGWAAGIDKLILKTTDGGTNWSQISGLPNSDLRSIHFTNIDTGWVVGHLGFIARSIDGGLTWTQLESGTTGSLKSVQFIDSQIGWTVGVAGLILKTIDGGGGEISFEENLTVLGWWHDHLNRSPSSIAGKDNVCLAGMQGQRLVILDFSTGWNPQKIYESWDIRPFDIQLRNNLAFVCDGRKGLTVLDITNPSNPSMVASSSILGSKISLNYKIAAIGQTIGYAASLVHVANISDLHNMTLLSTFILPHYTEGWDLKLRGDYIFVSAISFQGYPYGDFMVYDISNPTSPVRVYKEKDKFKGTIAITNNYAYVAISSGIKIYDISTASKPDSVAFSPFLVDNLYIDKNYLYVGSSSEGLRILDISEPINPIEVGYAEGEPHIQISTTGNKIYTGSGNSSHSRITLLRNDLISANPIIPVDNYILMQNFPNPFNPSTRIIYQVSEVSFITIKIYDVLGNEIVTLINEEKPAGEYEVEFHSHSGEVRNLPSGIYFYQLRAGEFVETKKMVLLK
jgi:photosystem II stability/assembly factor-like uncharacterized protein